MDDVWANTHNIDLLIMLDQDESTYDHPDTYIHYINLARYKQKFMPVLIAAESTPKVWLTDTVDNHEPIKRIVDKNVHNTNVVIKLHTVTDLAQFKLQLTDLTAELVQRNCRWIYYRAGKHEPLHRAATEILLGYPEFVLLNPGVFSGDVAVNIKKRIYRHWVDLYIKNNYERSRI